VKQWPGPAAACSGKTGARRGPRGSPNPAAAAEVQAAPPTSISAARPARCCCRSSRLRPSGCSTPEGREGGSKGMWAGGCDRAGWGRQPGTPRRERERSARSRGGPPTRRPPPPPPPAWPTWIAPTGVRLNDLMLYTAASPGVYRPRPDMFCIGGGDPLVAAAPLGEKRRRRAARSAQGKRRRGGARRGGGGWGRGGCGAPKCAWGTRSRIPINPRAPVGGRVVQHPHHAWLEVPHDWGEGRAAAAAGRRWRRPGQARPVGAAAGAASPCCLCAGSSRRQRSRATPLHTKPSLRKPLTPPAETPASPPPPPPGAHPGSRRRLRLPRPARRRRKGWGCPTAAAPPAATRAHPRRRRRAARAAGSF
jgi:hypothetical protein